MRLFLLIMFMLCGCNKTDRPFLQLERFGDHQTALYIVEDDGTVKFGGGFDALSGKTTWEGQLTVAQLSKLQELLRTDILQSNEFDDSNRFEIVIHESDVILNYVVPLTDPFASEVYFILEESTMQRIQSHLDSLPKPTMDVISDRKTKGSKH